MKNIDIKLIKWGLVFFGEAASLQAGEQLLEVTRADGSKAFSCAPSELKRVDYNSNNGMWTFKSKDGQKCNLVIKDEKGFEALQKVLEKTEAKGWVV